MTIKTPINSFLYRLLSDKFSVYVFLLVIICYIFIFAHYRSNNLIVIPINIISLSILIPIWLTDGLKIIIESLLPRKYYIAKEDLSKVNIIIPTKDGGSTLNHTLSSLTSRFPPEQIIVASNGSTDNTSDISLSYGVKLISIPRPVGKVSAINIALSTADKPYILIIDDDTILGNAIIPTNMLDLGYEAAAFRVLPEKNGWLSTLQLHEYRKSMDIGRCFHNANATVQSVSGAIGLFHLNELKRQIKLHSGEFSGEDLQRTLLILVSANRKGVVIVDSTVETDAPKTIPALFKQRVFGWNPGYIVNFKLYLLLVFKRDVPLRLRTEAIYSIFIVVLLDPLRLASLPVLLFSPAYIAIFYITYTAMETIPYLVMGRKDPYWVILVSPIYGLFNFLARILSIASFTFRRASFFLSRAEKYDDYQHSPFFTRLISFIVTATFYGSLIIFYSLLGILPPHDRDRLNAKFIKISSYHIKTFQNLHLANFKRNFIKLSNLQILKFSSQDKPPLSYHHD